jgi:histidinol-phosphatase (PHP family)
MLTDYHTHTYRCGHAVGTLREYIEAAIAKGIDEIGLTDHVWLYYLDPAQRDPGWAMPEQDFDGHYAEMVALRDEYRGRIAVRVSVEADYIEGREDDLARMLRRYDFDYVLGSVHFMDGWLMDHPDFAHRFRQERVAEIYRRYYRKLRNAVRLGLFDLLAHFDLPKKFGDLPEEDVADAVGETLDLVREHDLAIELSSAGFRKPIGESYPSDVILREMHRRNIPIAFSSDAHAPEEVGAGYDQLLAAAARAGYTETVTFEGRTRKSWPIV